MESEGRNGGLGAAEAAAGTPIAGGRRTGPRQPPPVPPSIRGAAASSNNRDGNRDAAGDAEKGEAGLSGHRAPVAPELPVDSPTTTAARLNINTRSGVNALALPAAIVRKVKRPSVAFKNPAPATTFWNDKKSFEQSRDMTFYREGTPPPSPPEMRYHSGGSSGGHHHYGGSGGHHQYSGSGGHHHGGGLGVGSSGGYNHDSISGDSAWNATVTSGYSEPYDYKYDHIAPPAPIPEQMIFGMRKRKFWIIFGAAVGLIVILAIAIGVGVGVGTQSSGGDDNANSDEATEGESTGDSTSDDPTPTSTSPDDEPTSTQSTESDLPTLGPSAACPSANNTMFEVSGSPKVFLRLCGLDYSTDDGATDVGVVWTANVQDCITNCAGFPGCVGAGWGVIEGDEGDNHRCWMKSEIGTPSETRAGWDFAILQEEEEEDDN